MSQPRDAGVDDSVRGDFGVYESAIQPGLIAASLMPVPGGWKVDYFSLPDFEGEPGRTFATYEQAIEALTRVLPFVNKP